jgi:hypothetical protein
MSTTRHVISRLTALTAVTSLVFICSVLLTTPAYAAPANQCPTHRSGDQPCLTDVYQTGHTITLSWYTTYRHDGYNVLWSRPGVQAQQFHIDGDAISATLNKIYPYTRYTFNVQGCDTHFLSSSTCTPWSNSITLATVGSSADVCVQGFVWREAGPKDYVCVTPNIRSQAASDNSQASARRNPSGAYGPDTCIQGFVWREAFTNDHVCVTPQTRDQASYDNNQAIYRVVH